MAPLPSAAQIRKPIQNRMVQPVLVFLIVTAIAMGIAIAIPPTCADTARPLNRAGRSLDLPVAPLVRRFALCPPNPVYQAKKLA